jgi:NitT/TauT family transport system substrate-binding protein
MSRSIFQGAAVILSLVLGAASAHAQALEKKSIKLAVGGKSSLYYLPLTIAEQLGYFKEQGLDVEINDFAGGAKALQAVVGGSADVVTGAYEHTIRMQTKGQDIRAVIELGRYPAINIMVRKDRPYKTAADLKGMKIGVSAPGSSTQLMAQFLLVQAGLKPDDASFIGVGLGASAVAAIKKGEIDAVSTTEPANSKLMKDGDVITIADTTSTEGVTKLLGGPMSAAVLYAKGDFIEKNPNTIQALVNAFHKTIKWIAKSTPEEIAAKMPEEFMLGDKALYIDAIKAAADAYSKDGVIRPDVQERSLAFLQKFEEEFRTAKIDLAKTWDGRFVTKAAELNK